MTSRDDDGIESVRHVHPPCPRCGKRMDLSGVESAAPGYETRNFECPSCGYAFGELVKISPPEP